jgi:DNA-binding IclR family transcriptional regulator
MSGDPIPSDVRRFLQLSSITIPHVEMILLLGREPAIGWAPADIARRLYVTAARASELLAQLETLGVVERTGGAPDSFCYRPATPELALLLDQLDAVYSKDLVAVTKLVHAARDHAAEQFAKAFQFGKDS